MSALSTLINPPEILQLDKLYKICYTLRILKAEAKRMAVLHITDENYEELVQSSAEPIILDFWADWCMPCKMLAPVLEELAEDENFIRVGKVNVDESPQLTEAFEVQTIPLLAVLRKGEVLESSVGVKSGEAVRAMVRAALES
jgi:thioredoxin 1